MSPAVRVPAHRGHDVPSTCVLLPGGRNLPVGTNGYTTSWGPSLSGYPSEL
ncbi:MULTISPECIES: hypothetical protein [Kocuria]|uniref:Uncharacterized protein n=1 Tax=Kocuria oceani TaxID=988827 RepID=A0ABV9TKR7_9MICC|nr:MULTISPECIES: hypothetical protein [Kocuria]